MGRPGSFRLQITGSAKRDIRAILKTSFDEFGTDAALRYRALIRQALLDIETDPERPGSQARPDLLVTTARTYHIAFSRDRVPGPRVKQPRHLVLYRHRDNAVIEVARVLHDARDLRLHLPADYAIPPN